MPKKPNLIATTFALVAAFSLTGCAVAEDTVAADSSAPSAGASESPDSGATPEITTAPEAPVIEKGSSTSNDTKVQLQYLIEEEKLAHDVYTKMFDLWGARVFGNILKSEESHQSQVLTVMENYNIKDVRLSGIGEFKNSELQSLYNELIAKGSKSAQDAYEVGVAIEELDIDDLTKMLATAKDSDVIAMMESLRRGSENHLRAFNNQL